MEYSIIIPVFNEEDSLPELIKRIKPVIDKIAPHAYEVIFVNDGSTDDSLRVIHSLMRKYSFLKATSFRKNQGKAAALSVGFDRAEGKFIFTMDADLQDEPKEIPTLITKMQEGYDLVSGWKLNRQDPLDKTIPSKVFNFIVSSLSGVKLHDFNCGFKLYKKQVTKEIEIYGQLYRFIPILANERGFKLAEVRVVHNKRKYGKSKYNWLRFFSGVTDLITVMYLVKFGKRPLHFFGFVGMLCFLIGCIIWIYLAMLHFTGHSISERPILIFSGFFIIAGLQLIFTGLLAEMITKYSHSNTHYPILDEA